jgi:metal-responsive CopG/Arc/MetJ family transcriptional regulator
MNNEKMKKFLISLPESLVKQLDKAAKKENRSRNNLIMNILIKYLHNLKAE